MIDDLIGDLVDFANRRDLHPICQAAVLHAQFETIHPFADGNGRVGRALVGWCLRRRGAADQIIPPISPILARQPDRYVHGLWLYREGRVDEWIAWFAEVCRSAARLVEEVAGAVAELQQTWRGDLSDLRSDSSALDVLELLPSTPLVSVSRVSAALRVSETAAREALETLEDRGVLTRVESTAFGRGRPRHLWVARGITDLL
jgi:Fic family protein